MELNMSYQKILTLVTFNLSPTHTNARRISSYCGGHVLSSLYSSPMSVVFVTEYIPPNNHPCGYRYENFGNFAYVWRPFHTMYLVRTENLSTITLPARKTPLIRREKSQRGAFGFTFINRVIDARHTIAYNKSRNRLLVYIVTDLNHS